MILFKMNGKYRGHVIGNGSFWSFHIYPDKELDLEENTKLFSDRDSALRAAREYFQKLNPPRGEPIEEYYERKVQEWL